MKQFSVLLFYLLILFLPTQLGRHFWPDFSLISGIRVDYLSPTLHVTDILILFLFITWVLNLLARHSGKRSASRISILQRNSGQARMTNKHMWQANFNAFDKLRVDAERSRSIKFQIVLLATVILIGIVLSKNQLAGLYGLLKLLEFIFLGFYAAYNFKKLRFDIVLVLFSVGIMFESFLAILQYINQTSIGGIFYFFGERAFNSQTPGIANASVNGELILRPYATFSHPNVLAGYLIIALTMIISNIKYQISNMGKIIFVTSLAVGTFTLFLTMSRIAILLWLFIVLMFGFVKIKRYLKNKFTIYYLLFTILIIGSIGSILLLSPLRFRFSDIRLSDESITQRGELVKDSFPMIKSHPVFGVGLNNFLVELPNVHKQDANVFYLQPVHNMYLLILSQTGVVGLAFFVWFLIKTYRFINHKSYILILLTSVLTLGMFDHYFLTLQQGQLLFSFVLGLCWSKMPSYKSLH